MADKVAIFIDGGYLSFVTKQLGGSEPLQIDFAALSSKITSSDELLRTYYYDSPPFVSSQPSEEERARQKSFDRFRYALNMIDRFEVRLGKLRRYYDAQGNEQFEQKGVDVYLAIDALTLAVKGRIQKAIFIIGDSDFVPVLQAIKNEGVETILYYANQSVNHHLLEVADQRILLSKEFLERCKR